MIITLETRTADSVRIYFEKTNRPEIRQVLPQKAKTVEEALADYEETLLPNATSFGQTVYVDRKYIGDVWCYCIDMDDEPNCMLSFCFFEPEYWSKGIATSAVKMFIKNVCDRYDAKTIGAFTFAYNNASVRVLEKNGFVVMEEFEEDGILSKYLQYERWNIPVHGETNMTLTVYEPQYSELWFKQLMLSDKETMSYNHAWGGTISFPEDRWTDWYERWIINPEGKRYYRYLKNGAGQLIGEIAWHFDACLTGYLADVVIYAKYRRQGYGTMALSMLCTIAKEHGISVLYDDIAIDNPAISMFLKHGFLEEYRTVNAVMLKKEL